MALRKLKPTTPATRYYSISTFEGTIKLHNFPNFFPQWSQSCKFRPLFDELFVMVHSPFTSNHRFVILFLTSRLYPIDSSSSFRSLYSLSVASLFFALTS